MGGYKFKLLKFYNKRVIIIVFIILIVAKALPVLNTYFSIPLLNKLVHISLFKKLKSYLNLYFIGLFFIGCSISPLALANPLPAPFVSSLVSLLADNSSEGVLLSRPSSGGSFGAGAGVSIFILFIVFKIFIGFCIGFCIKILFSRRVRDRGRFFSPLPLAKGVLRDSRYKGGRGEGLYLSFFICPIFIILLVIIIVYFDLINIVYCQGDDDIIVNDELSNKSIDGKIEDSYKFTISKNFVKDGFDSIAKVLSDSLPEIIGGLGGTKIAASVLKGSSNLPPLQKAGLGIITGGGAAVALGLGGTLVRNVRRNTNFGTTDDVYLKIPRNVLEDLVKGNLRQEDLVNKVAKEIVDLSDSANPGESNILKAKEIPPKAEPLSNSQGGATNIDNIADKGVAPDLSKKSYPSDLDGDGPFISSLMDNSPYSLAKSRGGAGSLSFAPTGEENLSPLEIIINSEIIINIMILFHIIIILVILLKIFVILRTNKKELPPSDQSANRAINKIDVSPKKDQTKSCDRFYCKILNKYKLQNLLEKIGVIKKKYLLILFIINILIIVFYIFLNIYINIELSNNLDQYIHVYNILKK